MLLSTMLSVVAETTSACQRCLCLGLCEQRMVHVIFCGQQANIHAKIAFSMQTNSDEQVLSS